MMPREAQLLLCAARFLLATLQADHGMPIRKSVNFSRALEFAVKKKS